MEFESFPTAFEGYSEGDFIFKIETFDSNCAKIKIDEIFTLESWRATAKEIERCIELMKLDVPTVPKNKKEGE